MKKYLMKTTDRVDNLEEAMVQIREQQNFQDDKFKQILQKIDSLNCPDIRGLESKIEKILEEKVNKIVGNNIIKELNYLVEELSLKTTDVNEGKRKIEELEKTINDKDVIIEHLNNTCAERKIKLEKLEISEEQQSYSRETSHKPYVLIKQTTDALKIHR